MREEFRDIKSFEGVYKISNLGRILSCERLGSDSRRVPEKLVKYRTNNKLYLTADLWDGTRNHKKLIHRLMAEAFIPNDDPEHKTHVNHKNSIRTHNWVDLDDVHGDGTNLEWICQKENSLDRNLRQKEFKEVLKAQRGMKIIENKREESEWNKKYSFMELFGL